MYTTTGYITLALCKLNASKTTTIEYKNHAENPHSHKTNPCKNAKESTMECLKTLHWSLIQQRIDYKTCTLIHKCYKGKTPSYLQNLLQEKKNNCPGISLENKKDVLAVPNTRNHTFASRSFSIYGPNLWNSFPDRIREVINFGKFKTKLKTHLFTSAYM